MWINRTISQQVVNTSQSRPVVLLTGARQTGKSSLLIRLFKHLSYITFDHVQLMETAIASPIHFLSQFKDSVILDEIQYSPQILSPLKEE